VAAPWVVTTLLAALTDRARREGVRRFDRLRREPAGDRHARARRRHALRSGRRARLRHIHSRRRHARPLARGDARTGRVHTSEGVSTTQSSLLYVQLEIPPGDDGRRIPIPHSGRTAGDPSRAPRGLRHLWSPSAPRRRKGIKHGTPISRGGLPALSAKPMRKSTPKSSTETAGPGEERPACPAGAPAMRRSCLEARAMPA
jgi:hypothetical protein